MLAEMEILSKVHVHEEVMKGSTNILHTDGTKYKKFQHWREQIIPFVVENFSMLPNAEREKISNMHHVFCGLHVIHNLGTYVEKAIYEWEKIVEE